MIGALLIDKPKGLTSHDVVARVRRIVGIRRVGHAGTLDPFATGLLILCLGRATRLAQFLVDLDKEYVAAVRLGFATDSQDLTGKQITSLTSSEKVSLDDVRRVLSEFTGPQLQTPPMFSAKKIAGERLYRAARAGREVERKPVRITIHSIELMGPLIGNDDGTRDFPIRVKCSSGSYIRTVAHDIGARLGVGAHLSGLRRTAVGSFGISRALSLEQLEARQCNGTLMEEIVRPAEMLEHLRVVNVGRDGVESVRHGRSIRLPAPEGDVPIRVCDPEGNLIAVGDYDPGLMVLRPRIVLIDDA